MDSVFLVWEINSSAPLTSESFEFGSQRVPIFPVQLTLPFLLGLQLGLQGVRGPRFGQSQQRTGRNQSSEFLWVCRRQIKQYFWGARFFQPVSRLNSAAPYNTQA